MDIRLHLIETITNGFSEDLKVGSGGYGDVYKGLYNGEEIAVKKFHPLQGLNDELFDNELGNLTKVSHPNVVRLLGYCYESRHKYLEYKGETIWGKSMERVLCFEYMQGGSLENYITDHSCQLDWQACYKIIRETCEGLTHLHNALNSPILHLNLKPSNILLDKSMTPKIADFGLSRIFASSKTHQRVILDAAPGYMPPEYIDHRFISKKFDVFSLGVIIIKIMAGNMGLSQYSEMSPSRFIELVSKNWQEKLHTMSVHSSHEIDILRVRTCLDIALRCVNANRHERPSIQEIILALEEQESGIMAIMPQSPDYKSNWVGEMYGSIHVTLTLVETITNNFAADQKIGSGLYADVYKAVHNGEEIVVKKFHPLQTVDDKAFNNELCNLIKGRHNNVIQLIGYCHESRRKIFKHKGELVFREMTERILCFEHMQSGNLDTYIADESCALDWPTCYNIIKGICKGLNHLHNAQEKPILHLDLNPANILLDKSMTPKIADLVFSRHVATTEIEITDKLREAKEYMPQEYVNRGIISKKFDVFSLGVIIIKMMAGNIGFSCFSEMPPKQFIELVSMNWKEKLHKLSGRSTHEMDILGVRTCVDIALRCLDVDRNKRPSIQEIIWVLEIKTIMSLPPDHKYNWFGVDYQSRSTTAPYKSKYLIETDIKTAMSPPPDSKDKVEAESKKNLIEAENKTLLLLPPDHKFIWSSLSSQSCSMTSSDQSNDLLLQMRSEPHMPLQYLKDITNNFSNDRIIGKGGFGVIYEGVLQNGESVAVKRLLRAIHSSQKQFENEVNLLMKLKHPNIMLLVGYCYETQYLRAPHEGKFIFTEKTESLLCLEYMPKGSLDRYISDASCGLDWHKRYIIIEGISFGLKYLHEQYNDLVIHVDLKPANILLDENMVPKITDFGLARLFEQTICTTTTYGTIGYMPPEYLRGIITPKWDIFSLGVIILEVITGNRDYPNDIRKDSERFIKLELQNWINRLQEEPEYASLETDCQQIERCIQIGLICLNAERTKRPTMKKIIDMLKGSESMNWYITNELSNPDPEQ